MLPLIGRVADLRGRLPVLIGSLVVFSAGSLVTAASYDLATMVVGRFLQGAGGGGLVPATLALVADIWASRSSRPAARSRRRSPGAGQCARASVRRGRARPCDLAHDLLDQPGGRAGPRRLPSRCWEGPILAVTLQPPRRDRADYVGALLATAALLALGLVMVAPQRLTQGLTTGLAYVSLRGRLAVVDSDGRRLLCPGAAVRRSGSSRLDRPLDRPSIHRRDPAGARPARCRPARARVAGVVLAFATADPEVQVFSPLGLWLLAGGAAPRRCSWRDNARRRFRSYLVVRCARPPRGEPSWSASSSAPR